MRFRVILLVLAGLASPASTQIGLPPAGQTIGSVTGELRSTVNDMTSIDLRRPVRSVTQMAGDRIARIAAFVRRNEDAVEFDDKGDPARKGVVLLLDADPASIETARGLGFAVASSDDFGALGLSATSLSVPAGMTLNQALILLRKKLPDKTLTADQIHFPGGESAAGGGEASGGPSAAPITTRVGIIDGGVAPAAAGGIRTRGFAAGAPAPSDHGTAVAYLLRHAGVRNILSADVYGSDPAGGNALAITRALDWLAREKIPVVSISLVGPRNPLLERAVMAAARHGMILVAAVGNDGPAAPPAFPASYPPVLAITGVDGRNRALIEAGRALHLDYAAPGADMKAPDRKGRKKSLRGTSFAAPLAAARAAAALERRGSVADIRIALDKEARDLGKKGADPLFGRGLLCARCRPR